MVVMLLIASDFCGLGAAAPGPPAESFADGNGILAFVKVTQELVTSIRRALMCEH